MNAFLTSLKKEEPAIFYQFQYPYSFKFDLILEGENYGDLEVVVKEGRDIAEIKGAKLALNKLDEINKEGSKFFWRVPPDGDRIMHYPVIYVDELASLLGHFCTFDGENVKFEPNGDFEKMLEFIGHLYHPINTDLLYEKTGILMLD